MATTAMRHAQMAPHSPPSSLPHPHGIRGVEANPLCPDLPIFDLGVYLAGPPACQPLCEALAACLHTASAVVVRDPRVDEGASEAFLDLMEAYFDQPREAKLPDVRPDLAYQVGATPDGTERPRCLADSAILRRAEAELGEADRPTPPQGPDSKWRFFWRLGERPAQTRFQELNAAPVVPAAFPEWGRVMDRWGTGLLATIACVAEAAARGWRLPPDAFTARMALGPHLLAPTGVDLGRAPREGDVYAGYHYDLNFLTAHGAARYPGLHAWLRCGRRVAVRIPRGCLLLQAGKQMEWLTGGHVRAGFHEVVCTRGTLEAAQRAQREGRPLWRVSSTVFSQIGSDCLLRPLGPFATEAACAAYPDTLCGEQVKAELAAINLSGTSAQD
uniref:Isopenicillin N synthase-like Fe(2+) 2OG dioxygenase domain-containing protein n=1 Tax=Auxenochlorella protothecoides TaxID=3075 RepID=A0A1D1ZZ37_AUXPR